MVQPQLYQNQIRPEIEFESNGSCNHRVDTVQQETVEEVEMQKHADVMTELTSLREQLESLCAENAVELERTVATMEESRRAFEVTLKSADCAYFSTYARDVDDALPGTVFM